MQICSFSQSIPARAQPTETGYKLVTVGWKSVTAGCTLEASSRACTPVTRQFPPRDWGLDGRGAAVGHGRRGAETHSKGFELELLLLGWHPGDRQKMCIRAGKRCWVVTGSSPRNHGKAGALVLGAGIAKISLTAPEDPAVSLRRALAACCLLQPCPAPQPPSLPSSFLAI